MVLDYCVLGLTAPVAFRKRGSHVKKGTFIATLPEKSDPHMGKHPFWIQKIIQVTTRRVKTQYYGPHFLGVYQPLIDVDNGNIPYYDYFQRGKFTTLHWDIAFTGKYRHDGGHLSAVDKRYLALDARVAWNGDSSSSS